MNVHDIARILAHSETLTEIPRTGYILEGVEGAERVSSHCFGVVLLTMLLSELVDGVDGERAVRMAIIHDLPESIIGDLTPSSSEYINKKKAEIGASKAIFSGCDDFHNLFTEFMLGESIESKLVHDADKLQMMARVHRYRRQGRGDMSRFSDVTFHFPVSQEILESFKRLDGVS